MTAPVITPTSASIALPCGLTSANVAWGSAGSPTILAVFNPGGSTAYVALGNGSGVVAVPATGIPIPPNSGPVFLAIGSNTTIAGICLSGATQLSITPST